MGVRTATVELTGDYSKRWTRETSEESHKVQISFLNPEDKREESETVYGLKEKLLSANAFSYLYSKF